MNLKKKTCTALYAAALVLTISTAPALAASALPAQPPMTSASRLHQVNELQSANWDSTVRTDINNFFQYYGKRSSTYDANHRPYAVFDFDNTTSIMDVEEQLMIWQLDHLAFAVTPAQLQKVLESGIASENMSLTYGADDGDGRPVRIDDAIHDAVTAYTSLYNKGAVSLDGREQPASITSSPDYQEFTAKMRWLYDAIGETMDNSVSYPWVTYWFTGMTPTQVCDLAYRCDSYYGNPQKGQTWTKGKYESPAGLSSRAGVVTVSYKNGITVTPEIKELYGALAKNGIDNWIDSASQIDVIRAAVKYFAIPGVKGIVAMTNQLDSSGRYINAYDYNAHAQTQGVGKALTISKVIAPKYDGHGPSFCAMDSQGDFNFCTEFKDTKEVLILNRQRKDDAAICAAIAVWQKSQGQTLREANLLGNTKFSLQGRNENIGQLWSDDHTLLLGKKDKAFLSKKAESVIAQLNQGKTIAQVLQANTKLKDYQGYKTR
jgi:hypothetical protein